MQKQLAQKLLAQGLADERAWCCQVKHKAPDVPEAVPPPRTASPGFWDTFIARNSKQLEARDEAHKQRMLELCLARSVGLSEEGRAALEEHVELTPKERAEAAGRAAAPERSWQLQHSGGDVRDRTAGARLASRWQEGEEPAALAVGTASQEAKTLAEVGVRVFTVVAAKIAVRSHCTLHSPKVGAFEAGDTIVVTESERLANDAPPEVTEDGDGEAPTPPSTVLRLHCLGGWVSATSTVSGVPLVVEEEEAADTNIVSAMSGLETRMRPVKAKQGSIDSFVQRQSEAAAKTAAKLAQGREAAVREADAVAQALLRPVKQRTEEVSPRLLRPTKAQQEAWVAKERRRLSREEAGVARFALPPSPAGSAAAPAEGEGREETGGEFLAADEEALLRGEHTRTDG